MTDHSHSGQHTKPQGRPNAPAHARQMYVKLLIMLGLSFIAMYALMYAMVDRFANVHNNLNQVYMAGLMAASMALIELGVMFHMYPNRRLNFALIGLSAIALGAFWVMTREQSVIGDTQFLRSMIPHHGGAILMCKEADIRDVEIVRLCEQILVSQQAEIDQMHAKLRSLKG